VLPSLTHTWYKMQGKDKNITMEILSLGHSSFRIKGKSATIVTDPFLPEFTGLKFPKNISADIITVSHDHNDHNAIHLVEGTPFVVHGPGEYEIKGVSIIGFSSDHDTEHGAIRGKNTMYRIEIDGISIVHAGDIGVLPPTKEVESLGDVDILMVPVGGTYTLGPEDAAKFVGEVEPKIVLPMHYQRPGLKPEGFAELRFVTDFLKQMGKEETPVQPKLVVTKDKMPTELSVVVFE